MHAYSHILYVDDDFRGVQTLLDPYVLLMCQLSLVGVLPGRGIVSADCQYAACIRLRVYLQRGLDHSRMEQGSYLEK